MGSRPWVLTARFGLAILGFVGFMSFFMQRNCVSVAIVCMVNHTAAARLLGKEDDGGWHNASVAGSGNSSVWGLSRYQGRNGTVEEGGCHLDDSGGKAVEVGYYQRDGLHTIRNGILIYT